MNSSVKETSLTIAVDWGTSHLRAYLCEPQPQQSSSVPALKLLAVRTGEGVTKVKQGFEHELFAVIQPWLDEFGTLPITLAGQIGSSIGWQETAYVSCPLAADDVRSQTYRFTCRGYDIAIVPGATCVHDNGVRDAMRGEELQVFGWLQQAPEHQIGEHLVCLPGTHTKWVKVSDGAIQVFKTALTGELYDMLSHQSVLIQERSATLDFATFEEGVNFTLNSGSGSFCHGLFSVRSKQLFGELTPTHSQSYLSGILIGTDVRAALNASEWDLQGRLSLQNPALQHIQHVNPIRKVSVIGSQQVSDCFTRALQLAGLEVQTYNEQQITIQGFAAL